MTAGPDDASNRQRVSPITSFAWALVAILAAWTLFIGGGWAGIYANGLRTISLGLAAAGFLSWAALAARRPDWRPRSAIWPALVVALGALSLSTIAAARPRIGIEYLAWSVVLAALYLFLVALLRHGYARERIGGLAALLGITMGLWYAWVTIRDWLDFWSIVGHLTPPPLRPAFEGLTLGNPSAVLLVSVLLWLAAAAGLGSATVSRRAVLFLQGVLTTFAIVASGSRAGWFALAVAVGGVGLYWLLTPDHRGALGRAVADRRVRAALVGSSALGGIVGLALLPGVLLRVSGGGGEALRGELILIALRQFADAPLLGRGPGSWVAERVSRTLAGEIDYYIPHAHDIYAQTAGELGLVGLAAGVVVFGCLAWLVLSAIRGADPVRRRYGWAALLGLVYFALHQLFDFYANMPAALFAVAIPVALLDATNAVGPPLPATIRSSVGRLGKPAIGALAVAVVFAMGGLAYAERTAGVEQEAVDLANAGHWAAADALAVQAQEADPDMPSYALTRGLTAMRAGRVEEAATAFAYAAESDDLPQSWLDLAAADIVLGRASDAHDALIRALRIGVQQPVVAYDAGRLLDGLGDTAAADDAYVAALTVLPSLAGDPSWGTIALGPSSATRWPALLDRAMAAAPSAAFELALTAGRQQQALALAAAGTNPSFYTDVAMAWAGEATALARVEATARAHPLDATFVAWAARLESRAGHATEASAYARWYGYLATSASIGVGEARVGTAEQAMPTQARVGNLATFYGHYTYRRPTPWDLLAPDLPRLVYP